MVNTYRLKASELDHNFLDKLKSTYGDQEIEISISNLTIQLELMADDPFIQAENQEIEQEFKITEMDGVVMHRNGYFGVKRLVSQQFSL